MIKVPYKVEGEAKHKMQPIFMAHFAHLTWKGSHYDTWMLHGHSHGTIVYPRPDYKILDVEVDNAGAVPVSFEQVQANMATRGEQ